MQAEAIDEIIKEMRMGKPGPDDFAYIIGRCHPSKFSNKPWLVPVHSTIERVTVAELADRIEEATANMRDALTKIAHYCDDRAKMLDPYSADAHKLSHIARLALGKEE